VNNVRVFAFSIAFVYFGSVDSDEAVEGIGYLWLFYVVGLTKIIMEIFL
jgi:hypothetical protein